MLTKMILPDPATGTKNQKRIHRPDTLILRFLLVSSRAGRCRLSSPRRVISCARHHGDERPIKRSEGKRRLHWKTYSVYTVK